MHKHFNFLNILIILLFLPLLVLFPLGIPASSRDGLGIGIYMLYYNFIFLLVAIRLFQYRNTEYLLKYRVFSSIILLLLLPHFMSLVALGTTTPIHMFYPLLYGPLLVIFIFIIRKTKLFYLYLLIFLAIPSAIVIKDYVDVKTFLNNCNEITPKAEYNPIYISEDFFHEEIIDGEKKLIPNVVEVDGKPKNKVTFINKKYYNKSANYIYIYWNCGVFINKGKYYEEFVEIIKYLSANNIIMCRQVINCQDLSERNKENCKYTREDTYSFVTKIYDVNESNLYTQRLISFSDYFVGSNLVRKIIPYRERVYCKYNKDDKPKSMSERKSDLDYNNYIKPLSEKPIELGENR